MENRYHPKGEKDVNRIISMLRLLRPWNNFVLDFLVVFSAAILASNLFVIVDSSLILLIVSASLAMMAATILDDLGDLEIDKIINKKRPLAQEALSTHDAWLLWIILCILCLSIALILGIIPLIGMSLAIILGALYGYKPKLKNFFIINELAIVLLFAIEAITTSIYLSGVIVPPIYYMIFFCFFGVLSARSLQGFLDYPYDIRTKHKTFQTLFGFKRASFIILGFSLIGYGIITPLFYLLFIPSIVFLVSMLLFLLLALISFSLVASNFNEKKALFAYQIGKIYSLGICWSIIITSLLTIH